MEKIFVSDRLLGVLRPEPSADYKAARAEALEKKYVVLIDTNLWSRPE